MIARLSLASMSAERRVGLGEVPWGAGAVLFDDVVWMMSVDGVPDDRERHRQELERDGALDGELGAVARVADAGLVLGRLRSTLRSPSGRRSAPRSRAGLESRSVVISAS